MNNKTESPVEQAIIDTFISCLDALKEVEPNTPEWDLMWGILHSSKKWFEVRHAKKQNNPIPG